MSRDTEFEFRPKPRLLREFSVSILKMPVLMSTAMHLGFRFGGGESFALLNE
jgi:hypothetical protein